MVLDIFTGRGLYSFMLVKTAHKDFPRELLGEAPLERGEWVGFSTTKDDVKLQARRFKDLKTKDFISTCSSTVTGNPCRTKHSGAIPHPKVAEEYLKYAASIDIHIHYRCGNAVLEDVWHTHNPHLHQFSRVLGFCFTNAYIVSSPLKLGGFLFLKFGQRGVKKKLLRNRGLVERGGFS